MMLRAGRHRASRADQSGAVAVEFALVLPVLLLLVFGIIQFGIVLAQQNALNGAVRTGARFGSVNAYAGSHTCGAVVDRVQSSAKTIGVGDGSNVDVDVYLGDDDDPRCTEEGGTGDGTPACKNDTASLESPEALTVQASFTSEFLVPMPFVTNSITLTSEGVYQCEYH